MSRNPGTIFFAQISDKSLQTLFVSDYNKILSDYVKFVSDYVKFVSDYVKFVSDYVKFF